MSEIRATTISDLAGTGPATLTGQYAAKAWVNFNGQGTVSIRESGNVASITDDGIGIYTANFTAAVTDSNYSVSTTVMETGSTGGTDWSAAIRRNTSNTGSMATTFIKLAAFTSSAAAVDPGVVVATITR
jgi:hypothetical protein